MVLPVSFAESELPKDLGLQNLEGESQSLDSSRKLIYFWATWCKSCLPKMQTVLPNLQKSEKIQVVTVNMDKSVKRAKKYYRKMDLTLPVYRDGKNIFEKSLKIKSLPHWAVVENKGDGWKVVAHERAFNLNKVKSHFK